MRAALISLPHAGEDPMPAMAGKSIAERQLLFARELGCESIIAHGNGAARDSIELRHAAERLGLRYQVISNSHALAGIIRDEDSLLVLQPGLVPEARAALDLLRAEGDRMLVVSAGPGAAAGFERIDLDRAWAGALTIPGRLLGALESLPHDVAPHGALLRIALQNKLPEARLPDGMLDDARWSVITSKEMAAAREGTWQRAHLGRVSPAAVARWLGRSAVSALGTRLLAIRHSRAGLLLLTALALGGALAAGIYERPVLGFALLALAVPLLETFLALSRLAVAPFGQVRRLPWLRRTVDATLLALGIMAIDSLAHRTIYPPVILAALLYLLDRRARPNWLEPVADRMVVAGFLAIVSAIATPEIAIMLASLAVLAANFLQPRG